MKNIIDLTIDINKSNYTTIPAVQFDSNSRFLQVQLINNGVACDVTGHTVVISGYKQDDTSIFNYCKIIDATNGLVEVQISEQINAIEGKVDCELKIYGTDNSVLTTKPFIILVTKSVSNKNVVSSNEFTALTEALSKITNTDKKFHDINIELESKISNSELENKKWSMQNMGQDVKEAITGGAVAVVGVNAVGTENIQTKAVGNDKVDHSIMKNALTNLISTQVYKGTNNNGCTSQIADNGTVTMVSNTSYGTFSRVIKVEPMRKYILISKVKLNDNSVSGVSCKQICYCYDTGHGNLGTVNDGILTSLTTTPKMFMNTFEITKANTVTGHFGIFINKESTVIITEQILLDVTGIDNSVLSKIDFSKFNNGYWSRSIENVVLQSEYSTMSTNSEHAKISDEAKYALDGNFIKPINKYFNLMGSFDSIVNGRTWANGSTINVLHDTKEIEVTPGASYGELLIWTPNKSGTLNTPIVNGRKYKIVAKVKGEAGASAKFTCFMFSQSGANLGSISTGLSGGISTEYNLFSANFIINKPDCYRLAIGISNTKSTTPFPKFIVKDFMLIDVTDEPLTHDELLQFDNQYWEVNPQIVGMANKSLVSAVALSLAPGVVPEQTNIWKGKNALVIGDSITASLKWQKQLQLLLGMHVTTHAKGGIGIIQMVDGDNGINGDYDNSTDASGTLRPLDVAKVTGKDLIVVLAGYNERHLEYGNIGDVHPTNNTLIGKMQYLINRIYDELRKANNLTCKVLIATPHCAGKYPYVDADGYQQHPPGSGRTMETMSDAIKKISNYNNIPACDLWHNSGINKFTWSVYSASPNATNPNPGSSSTPYPNNGDQLHLNDKGSEQIGRCIVGAIIKSYGY